MGAEVGDLDVIKCSSWRRNGEVSNAKPRPKMLMYITNSPIHGSGSISFATGTLHLSRFISWIIPAEMYGISSSLVTLDLVHPFAAITITGARRNEGRGIAGEMEGGEGSGAKWSVLGHGRPFIKPHSPRIRKAIHRLNPPRNRRLEINGPNSLRC
jgi:hypothetical protein